MNQVAITSRDNSLLQRARAVREGLIKELIFVEGLRLCEEALRSKLAIEAVIYSDEIAEKKRAKDFLAAVTPVATRLAPVSEKLLATISYTKTPQGVVLLGISVDKSNEKYKNFLKRYNVTFPTSHDPAMSVSDSYATYRYPETYIIGRDGRVVEKIVGRKNWTDEKFIKSLQALL